MYQDTITSNQKSPGLNGLHAVSYKKICSRTAILVGLTRQGQQVFGLACGAQPLRRESVRIAVDVLDHPAAIVIHLGQG